MISIIVAAVACAVCVGTSLALSLLAEQREDQAVASFRPRWPPIH